MHTCVASQLAEVSPKSRKGDRDETSMYATASKEEGEKPKRILKDSPAKVVDLPCGISTCRGERQKPKRRPR